MATYIYFNCHRCNSEITTDSSITSIGTTHVICPNCFSGNRTESSPFSYKNFWGKIYTFIEALVSMKFIMFWILPPFVLVNLALGDVFEETLIPYVISASIMVLVRLYFLQKKIREVELRQKDIERELEIEPV